MAALDLTFESNHDYGTKTQILRRDERYGGRSRCSKSCRNATKSSTSPCLRVSQAQGPSARQLQATTRDRGDLDLSTLTSLKVSQTHSRACCLFKVKSSLVPHYERSCIGVLSKFPAPQPSAHRRTWSTRRLAGGGGCLHSLTGQATLTRLLRCAGCNLRRYCATLITAASVATARGAHRLGPNLPLGAQT